MPFWRSLAVTAQANEATLRWLESRISNRKYMLGVSAAPLAALLLNIGQVQQVTDPTLDTVLQTAVGSLFVACCTSFVYLTRFVYWHGLLLSGMAQGAKSPVEVKIPSYLLNLIEWTCIVTGYLSFLWFLWESI